MLKTVHRYEQTAARLVVEGYPDRSDGQEGDTIGILSAWRLQLVGAPELEGTRDHLEAMMAAVMPYARHQLSGVGRRFETDQGFVVISPEGDRHQLELRSSRDGVEPLKLRIDDAELSDLVRVLDRLRLDQRVQLAWQLPADQPLARHELVERIPLQRRFGAPLLGGLALAVSALVAMVIPLPTIETPQPAVESAADTTETRTESTGSSDSNGKND